MFSFGIVLWEILTGEEPYANMHYGAIIGVKSLICSFPYATCALLCETKPLGSFLYVGVS